MRLNDLFEQSDLTTCQYLTTKGIKFNKTKRADESGADFVFDDLDTLNKDWKLVKKNKNLAKHFDFTVDSKSNTIKVYFK